MLKKAILMAVTLIFLAPCWVFAGTPSYNSITAGYVVGDGDNGEKYAGFSTILTYELSEHLFLRAKYANRDGDFQRTFSTPIGNASADFDSEITGKVLGLGLKKEVGTDSSAFLFVAYKEGKQENDVVVTPPIGPLQRQKISVEVDGHSVEAGFRTFALNNLELIPYVQYIEIEGDGVTSVGIGGTYFLTDSFALTMAFQDGDNGSDRLFAGLQYNF